MIISPSLDAPHLVRPKLTGAGADWFVAPYRNGPHTGFMTERQLEAAYRIRHEDRRQRASDLREVHAELVGAAERFLVGSGVVAVAQPELPTQISRRYPLAAFLREFQRTWKIPWRHTEGLDLLAPSSLLNAAETKRGLRRFTQRDSRTVHPLPESPHVEAQVRALAEIHFDGTVAVAFGRGGASTVGKHPQSAMVATIDIEQVVLDLFCLALAHCAVGRN